MLIPQLTSTSAIRWLLPAGAALVAVLLYVWLGGRGTRWALYTLVPVLAVATVVVVHSRVWVDPEQGVVRWHRRWVRRRHVVLADATEIALVGTGRGVRLRVRDERHGGDVPLLAMTSHVQRSQSPEVLQMVADALERHAGPEHRGRVAQDLRAQAEHLAGGGDLAGSPLTALVR